MDDKGSLVICLMGLALVILNVRTVLITERILEVLKLLCMEKDRD